MADCIDRKERTEMDAAEYFAEILALGVSVRRLLINTDAPEQTLQVNGDRIVLRREASGRVTIEEEKEKLELAFLLPTRSRHVPAFLPPLLARQLGNLNNS